MEREQRREANYTQRLERRRARYEKRRASKHKPLWGILWFIVFVLLVAACIGIPTWLFATKLVARLGMAEGWTVFLGACLAALCFMLLIYIPLLLLKLYMGRHPREPERLPIYDDVLEALEQLATGDFSVVLDIDERYERFMMGEVAERLNKLARELSGMETMRQDFVANVSHEIQSPLTSIRGFAGLLKKPDLDEEKRRHYLDVISAECDRLSKLSDNLLKLSLLDDGASPLRLERFRLDKQLASVLLVLEPQWRQKSLNVELNAPPVEFTGDAALLEQIWLNLVHNAVKFTPEGGSIHVSLAREAEFVAVTVADTGPGIPEADRPHVFERFYKGDKSRGSGGSGLGLSLVKRIAELHGGRVRLRGETPGATFVVELKSAENCG